MMSKDNKKNEVISSFSHLEEIEISQEKTLYERVYFPNWENRPKHETISIKAKNLDSTLCKTGGHILICAGAGVGKSSIVEAVVSSVLNPECDSLGIKIILPELNQKVLILDTERSQGETWDAWLKIMRRTGIEHPFIDNRLIFANCKALSVKERKEYVSKIVSENEDIGLVVFDGSADFVASINDEKEVTSFNDWVNTFSPLITIIHTIHTNPSDTKPRGWLGSELWRRANSVLLAKKIDEIVELTSAFDNGKVRHGSPFNHYFYFDTEIEMFVSTDERPTPKKQPSKSATKWQEIATTIFAENDTMQFADIVKQIGTITNKDYIKSKNAFFDNFQNKLCEKIEINGKPFWKLI